MQRIASSLWSLDSMQQSAASPPFGDELWGHQNTTGAAPRNDGTSTSWATASSATKRRRNDDATPPTPTSSFSMIVSQEEVEHDDYSEEEGFSCSNKRLKQRGAPDRVGGGTETSPSWPIMPHLTPGGTSGNGNINNTSWWSQEEEEKPQEMQREEALVWWKQKPRVVIPTTTTNNNGNHRHGPACSGDINNHRNHQDDRCFVCWRPHAIEEKVATVPRRTVSMTPNALLNYFRPKQQQQQQPLLSATTNLGPCAGTARRAATTRQPHERQHQQEHQKRQVVILRRCTCTYCERSPVCTDCMRDCEDCREPFCSFCTTTDYDRGPQERILCLERAGAYKYRNGNGNHGSCRNELLPEDDEDGDATMHMC